MRKKIFNYSTASVLFLSSIAFLFTFSKKHTEEKENKITLSSLIPDVNALILRADGKDSKKILRKLYTRANLQDVSLPKISSKFLQALEHQESLLKEIGDKQKFGNIDISTAELRQVVEAIKKVKSPQELNDWVDMYQICGSDMRGNVRFTGYYSPIVHARHKREVGFDVPVYISLKNTDDLHVVYVSSKEEIRRMRIEGYSYLVFSNGDRQLIAYDGNSRAIADEENNITNALVTHTVFTPKEKIAPTGSGKVPLTANYTVAVDNDFIPLGSVLLAEVPIIDEKGNLVGKELRFVLAQDTGSAIQGSGHIDLYMGEGETAKRNTRFMNKYGKVWLLLPKTSEGQNTLAENIEE